MDRISELPEFIVYHILSFLNSPTELVRMSVLSKTWFHLTASFPVFDLNINIFKPRESFYKYVDYATARFCLQDFTAHKFELVATIREPAELDVVNKCLELVLKKGMKELIIEITNSSSASARYRLPDALLSVSVLESLVIRVCELPSSLMLHAVNFKSLIKLTLVNVPIDDEVIEYLITSCPLLQHFLTIFCHGFKRFCVCGHQNLQLVWICYDTPVERIDIEAPNLSTLYVANISGNGAPQMNVALCKKLTTVTWIGWQEPTLNDFTDFLSNFPYIESLDLVGGYKCNNLKLSSPSLRTLVLYPNFDLEGIEFNTPNLVALNYSWKTRAPLIMDLTHSKACMRCDPYGSIDILWFLKLRLFLDKNNGFKIMNLYIHAICSQKLIEIENLKAIELPPYELEHVELELDASDESLDHIAFVDVVLWCCRPQSLTLRSSFLFEEQSDLVKFTQEKLLQQEDQGIQIASPSSSLSMALSSKGKAISFRKREVVQEKAG